MEAFHTTPDTRAENSRFGAPRHEPARAGGLGCVDVVASLAGASMPPMERHALKTIGNGDTIRPVASFLGPEQDQGPDVQVAGAGGGGSGGGSGGNRDTLAAAVNAFVGMPLVKVERLVIEANILACGGSLPKAARVLGVSPSTLYRKRAGWINQIVVT